MSNRITITLPGMNNPTIGKFKLFIDMNGSIIQMGDLDMDYNDPNILRFMNVSHSIFTTKLDPEVVSLPTSPISENSPHTDTKKEESKSEKRQVTPVKNNELGSPFTVSRRHAESDCDYDDASSDSEDCHDDIVPSNNLPEPQDNESEPETDIEIKQSPRTNVSIYINEKHRPFGNHLATALPRPGRHYKVPTSHTAIATTAAPLKASSESPYPTPISKTLGRQAAKPHQQARGGLKNKVTNQVNSVTNFLNGCKNSMVAPSNPQPATLNPRTTYVRRIEYDLNDRACVFFQDVISTIFNNLGITFLFDDWGLIFALYNAFGNSSDHLKSLCSSLINNLHPDRRRLFPYVKELSPDWWPFPIRYKDPAHLHLTERQCLLIWLFANPHHNEYIINETVKSSLENARGHKKALIQATECAKVVRRLAHARATDGSDNSS